MSASMLSWLEGGGAGVSARGVEGLKKAGIQQVGTPPKDRNSSHAKGGWSVRFLLALHGRLEAGSDQPFMAWYGQFASKKRVFLVSDLYVTLASL